MTSITRRSVLRGAIAMAAGAFAGRTVLTPIRVFAQARPGASAEGVKALERAAQTLQRGEQRQPHQEQPGDAQSSLLEA